MNNKPEVIMPIIFEQAIKLKIKKFGLGVYDESFTDASWASNPEISNWQAHSLFANGSIKQKLNCGGYINSEKAWVLADRVDVVRNIDRFYDPDNAFYKGGNPGQANINVKMIIPGIYTYKNNKWYNEKSNIVWGE